MFWDFLSKPATPLVANDYDHSQDLENTDGKTNKHMY